MTNHNMECQEPCMHNHCFSLKYDILIVVISNRILGQVTLLDLILNKYSLYKYHLLIS